MTREQVQALIQFFHGFGRAMLPQLLETYFLGPPYEEW